LKILQYIVLISKLVKHKYDVFNKCYLKKGIQEGYNV
jgi:hypothetical protein